MIKVTNLSKSFDEHVVFDGINLDVNDGEILVILGASGIGKSVLLKLLMGLLKPDGGSIAIDDVDITQLSEAQLLKLRKTIGYLFQEGALYDYMTVFENISFPLKEHTGFTSQIIKQKVKDILKVVDLEGIEEKYPSDLSGGMKKRVGLARAVILDSKIILCDEPTSGLDPIRSRDISDLIQNISRNINCTTIITSHDIENSFRIADRVALVSDGKIAALGTRTELKASQNSYVRKFIGS
jgi:phospholipid/cholesterol/gamma-HCH transport system ATP-binding protein